MTRVTVIIAHQEKEPPLLDRARVVSLGWGGHGLELIHVSGNMPSRQRNEAAQKAQGDILYFLDNDALPDAGNLERIIKVFESDPEVAVCGGPSLTPEDDSLRQTCFGYVLSSFWGSAWMSARYGRKGRPRVCTDRELILCNLTFRRDRFLQHNGFDEALYPNEENDLMDRIGDSGGKLFYHPGITVERSQRRGFRAFFQQLFGYGRGRSEQLRTDFRFGKLPLFAFAGLPVYLTALPFLAHSSLWFLFPLLFHFALDILFSLPLLVKRPAVFFIALPSFFFCHLFYGLGMWRGLFGKFRSAKVVSSAVKIRVIAAKRGPRSV